MVIKKQPPCLRPRGNHCFTLRPYLITKLHCFSVLSFFQNWLFLIVKHIFLFITWCTVGGGGAKASALIKSFLSFCSRVCPPFNSWSRLKKCSKTLLPRVNPARRLKADSKSETEVSFVRVTIWFIAFFLSGYPGNYILILWQSSLNSLNQYCLSFFSFFF